VRSSQGSNIRHLRYRSALPASLFDLSKGFEYVIRQLNWFQYSAGKTHHEALMYGIGSQMASRMNFLVELVERTFATTKARSQRRLRECEGFISRTRFCASTAVSASIAQAGTRRNVPIVLTNRSAILFSYLNTLRNNSYRSIQG